MSKYSKDNENIKGKRMSDWKTVKIGDICEQINGVSYKPADVYDSLNENATVLLRANNIFEDKLNYDELVFVDKKRVSDIQYMKKGDILICASSGSKHLVGKAACLSEDKELTFGAFCKVLRPKTVNPEFIKHYFFSPSYRTEISRLSEGANINNIKAADLDNLTLPLPTESEQKKIAKQLDKCIKIINNQKRSLEKYDLLIKSRFIEMFGDPVTNPMKWEAKKLAEIYEIIDGDRGKNYPKAEDFSTEGYSLFLNAGNVTKTGFVFNECQFISKEKDSVLRKGKLNREDIVVTTRGTVGNIAEYTNDIRYENIRINSGMVILRKRECVNTTYFLHYFRNPAIYRKLISGTAQPQMPIADMRNCSVILPPLELQQQFSAFVQQIDKSKFAVQKSLEKTETLYKSLMQQYFA